MCIFAAEWFSLSVSFFTARDGVVMFSHYFKQFCILVQIATTSPDMLQNRSRKSPDSPWKSFFSPTTTYFSTKSRWQNFVSGALQRLQRGPEVQNSITYFHKYGTIRIPRHDSRVRPLCDGDHNHWFVGARSEGGHNPQPPAYQLCNMDMSLCKIWNELLLVDGRVQETLICHLS